MPAADVEVMVVVLLCDCILVLLCPCIMPAAYVEVMIIVLRYNVCNDVYNVFNVCMYNVCTEGYFLFFRFITLDVNFSWRSTDR